MRLRRKTTSTATLLAPIGLAGLMLLMLGSAVVVQADSASTTVSSNIAAVISLLTTSGTVNVNVTPSGSGAQTIASDTVTVSTSDTAGYTLQLADTGAQSGLVSGGNTIVASSGTPASPVSMTTNTWGFRVDSLGGFGAGPTTAQSSTAIGAIKFAAVPATGSPATIKTTASTASNDTTTVWYAVAADTSQPAGTYTDSVTYTAVSN
jgi:hypothetical protein